MSRPDISAELGLDSQAAGMDPRYAALQAVIDRAVALGLADSVSITEIRDDGLLTRVSSDELTAEADRLQYDLDEGPCVDSSGDQMASVIVSGDTAHDARWPRWGPRAAKDGCAAVISIQLFTAGRRPIGAVNMFHRAAREYGTPDVEAAGLVATHASIALAQGKHDEHLWRAIDGRHDIGLAQGIIMQRFGVTEEHAFGALLRISQNSNVKLHRVAQEICRTRRIPGVDEPAPRPEPS